MPYRSPQQHLTETPATHSLKKNDEAPSPELPEICYNKKDATVKYVVPCRCFQFAGKIHLIMIQTAVQGRTDPGVVSTWLVVACSFYEQWHELFAVVDADDDDGVGDQPTVVALFI